MPIYEYYCKKCNKKVEVLQKITEKPKRKCPMCGASIRKLISETAFQLKGTGWYLTDFKNSKPKKEDKAKPEAKSEAKPDVSEKKETKKVETKKKDA